jgi:hypothetical protein
MVAGLVAIIYIYIVYKKMSYYDAGGKCGNNCFTEGYYVETEKKINKEVGLMSSSFVDTVASKNVYGFQASLTGDALAKKGVGMNQKQGSGGNSYLAYLRGRRGNCLCN